MMDHLDADNVVIEFRGKNIEEMDVAELRWAVRVAVANYNNLLRQRMQEADLLAYSGFGRYAKNVRTT